MMETWGILIRTSTGFSREVGMHGGASLLGMGG